MNRITVTGADRHPTGAHHLPEEALVACGGVEIGERIVIVLIDEALECDAIVQTYAGWEPHLFGREVGQWRMPTGA